LTSAARARGSAHDRRRAAGPALAASAPADTVPGHVGDGHSRVPLLSNWKSRSRRPSRRSDGPAGDVMLGTHGGCAAAGLLMSWAMRRSSLSRCSRRTRHEQLRWTPRGLRPEGPHQLLVPASKLLPVCSVPADANARRSIPAGTRQQVARVKRFDGRPRD